MSFLILTKNIFKTPLQTQFIRSFSGHNKWSKIKRSKAIEDLKRGNLYTKIANKISASIISGGSDDPDKNPRLQSALSIARSMNLPKNIINNALTKGKSKDSKKMEYIMYEGFGPGGIALLIDTLSDSKNRTAGLIRHVLSSNGGKLDKIGSVQWMFNQKPLIKMNSEKQDLNEVLDISLEHNVEDVREDNFGNIDIFPDNEHLITLTDLFKSKGYNILFTGISYIPSTTSEISDENVVYVDNLLNKLYEEDVVQNVTHNGSNIEQMFY